MDSISKAQEVAKSAGHWKRKLRTRKGSRQCMAGGDDEAAVDVTGGAGLGTSSAACDLGMDAHAAVHSGLTFFRQLLRGGLRLRAARGSRCRLGHEAHLLAIPALAAPAQAFGIDDASASAAAPWIV
jgi:hypothetical protein